MCTIPLKSTNEPFRLWGLYYGLIDSMVTKSSQIGVLR